MNQYNCHARSVSTCLKLVITTIILLSAQCVPNHYGVTPPPPSDSQKDKLNGEVKDPNHYGVTPPPPSDSDKFMSHYTLDKLYEMFTNKELATDSGFKRLVGCDWGGAPQEQIRRIKMKRENFYYSFGDFVVTQARVDDEFVAQLNNDLQLLCGGICDSDHWIPEGFFKSGETKHLDHWIYEHFLECYASKCCGVSISTDGIRLTRYLLHTLLCLDVESMGLNKSFAKIEQKLKKEFPELSNHNLCDLIKKYWIEGPNGSKVIRKYHTNTNEIIILTYQSVGKQIIKIMCNYQGQNFQ